MNVTKTRTKTILPQFKKQKVLNKLSSPYIGEQLEMYIEGLQNLLWTLQQMNCKHQLH